MLLIGKSTDRLDRRSSPILLALPTLAKQTDSEQRWPASMLMVKLSLPVTAAPIRFELYESDAEKQWGNPFFSARERKKPESEKKGDSYHPNAEQCVCKEEQPFSERRGLIRVRWLTPRHEQRNPPKRRSGSVATQTRVGRTQESKREREGKRRGGTGRKRHMCRGVDSFGVCVQGEAKITNSREKKQTTQRRTKSHIANNRV